MKILLTGASGFIGRHLKHAFQDHVIVAVRHERLKNLKSLERLIQKEKPQIIIHAAAYGNMSFQTDEEETFQANVINTLNLLKATKDTPYELFINISTSSVYGKINAVMHERRQMRPDTMYAATKGAAELLCRAHRKQYKKNIVSVRPFSVYGPGEADFRFIPTLIRNEKEGIESEVIEGMHDWIYIDDFVNAISKIIDNREHLIHRVYNIGTGLQTSNIYIAELITKNYEYNPKPKKQDSPVWYADIERMKELNWKPSITLEQGIKRCIAYYGN